MPTLSDSLAFIRRRGLVLLLAVFLALGAVYSLVTPVFEAGDELWHYPFVQWLATGHGLPVQDPAHKELWEQEGGQPPLYYGVAAATTFWIDTSDLRDRLWRNPFSHSIGNPLAFGNKNLVVHTPAEDFPWRGTTLAIHLLRFLSLFMGAGTVALSFLLLREILSRSSNVAPQADLLSLAASAIVAFNPMFLFISGSVNNDNLATLLAALGLYLTVQLVTCGPGDRRLLLLGIVCGLGALTKVSDLALLPLSGVVVLALAWQRRDLAWLVRAGFLLAIPAALIAGWWYVRNFWLYGDPLAFNVWVQVAGGRPPVTLLGLIPEFQGFRISFWGNFGGVNLIAPEWVYTSLDLLSLAALGGLVLGALRRRLTWPIAIPALWLAVIFLSLIRWTLMTYASQGRLIFPAISAVGVLMALGLGELGDFVFRLARARQIGRGPLALPAVAVLFLFAFALATPPAIIAPAYALPVRLPANAAVPNPVGITFDGVSGEPELAGYQVGRAVRPGEELPVTLYWRESAPVDADVYVYIHLYDAQGNRIGQWESYPGNGMYPATLWQPGELIEDRYRVPVAFSAAAPQLARVEAGLARVGSVIPLTARDTEGREIVPSIGRFKISAPRPSASALPSRYHFAAGLDVLQFSVHAKRGISEFEVAPPRDGALTTPLAAGDRLDVSATLRAAQVPSADYTVFVHLVGPDGRVAAQQDRPPSAFGGSYPTSLWDRGEEVTDHFELRVPDSAPAGDYQIEFGLYLPPDGPRSSVIGLAQNGLTAAGDHLLLAPLPLR